VTKRAVIPPKAWMTHDPAKSTNPKALSQPFPKVQWAKTG